MKDIDILIFGDSITYGAWDNEKGGWVNRLRLALENKNETYFNIYNLGISGDTTLNLKKRFDNEFFYRFSIESKTIIIFSIGINDSQIVNSKSSTYINNFRENIIELIDKARKFSSYVLFIGLTRVDEARVMPVYWDDDISYSNEEIIKYNKELKNICEDKKVDCLDVFDLLNIKDLDDGLHPNNNGHQKLCEVVLKYLQDKFF